MYKRNMDRVASPTRDQTLGICPAQDNAPTNTCKSCFYFKGIFLIYIIKKVCLVVIFISLGISEIEHVSYIC